MESESENLNGENRRLVDELLHIRKTNARLENAELNPEKLKSLKGILRRSDQLLRPLFFYLLEYFLWKDNVVARLYAVLLIDEIFRCSHQFRECVIENFEEFLHHAAETDPIHFPVPPPKNLAKILKQRTLKIVHSWFSTYGPAYRKLQVAYSYLKSSKMFDFQRIEAETIVERESNERERQRQEERKEKVVKKVADDLRDVEEEMTTCLTEINSGFRLLIPLLSETDGDPGETSGTGPTNTDGSPSTSLHVHGIPTAKFDLPITISFRRPEVQVDRDNADLVNSLKDCYKLITGQFLPKIRQLLNVLSRYGGDESLTKQLIDKRVLLEDAKQKYENLKLESVKSHVGGASATNGDEEDDFEIVPEKEGLEEVFRPPSPDLPDHIRDWSKSDSVRSKRLPSGEGTSSGHGTSKIHSGFEKHVPEDEPSTSADQSFPPVPVIPYGIDLEYWGQDKVHKPMIVRANADCHRFWRPADGEDTVQCSDVEAAAYRTRVYEFVGEFQPVERECRAPLETKEGRKLCTRRDRSKCPFHGLIVPRDEQGNPLEGVDVEIPEQSVPSTLNVFGTSDLIRDVERATGVDLAVGKKSKKTSAEMNSSSEGTKSTRERLVKKVFNRSSVKRVAAVETALDTAKQKKRFGGQWQYVFRDQ